MYCGWCGAALVEGYMDAGIGLCPDCIQLEKSRFLSVNPRVVVLQWYFYAFHIYSIQANQWLTKLMYG